MIFHVIAVDPVEDVEAPIAAQGEEVVAGDALGLARLGHQEELGQDGDGLEVNAEGPEDLHGAELVVHKEGEQGARGQQEFDSGVEMRG